MEHENYALETFVRLHARRLAALARCVPAGQRVAFLARHSCAGIALDVALEPFTEEQIVDSDEFDTASPLVRWLLRQIQTYDCDSQHVLGLRFGKGIVLAHVVQAQKIAANR